MVVVHLPGNRGGVSNLFLGADEAYAVNIGTNPTPKVDIAVSLPSDYQGTFLEFKKELTDRLIAEGMEAGTFRITDTAAKIDMSNTDGWYVYDHYRDDAAYNALNLSAEQKLKQPYQIGRNQWYRVHYGRRGEKQSLQHCMPQYEHTHLR